MHLVTGHTDLVCRWASKFFEGQAIPSDWAFGIVDGGGVLRGAIIGHQCNPWTAEVTFCGDKAFTNGVIKDFFRLYFIRYGRMQISTSRLNRSVKRNAPKWGFRFEGVAHEFYGIGRDALRYSMTRETCRWIKGRDESGKLAAPSKINKRHRVLPVGADDGPRIRT